MSAPYNGDTGSIILLHMAIEESSVISPMQDTCIIHGHYYLHHSSALIHRCDVVGNQCSRSTHIYLHTACMYVDLYRSVIMEGFNIGLVTISVCEYSSVFLVSLFM